MFKLVCVVLIAALSACGGRVAKPVQQNRASDALLTCQHISAEREVNETRILDLVGETDFANNNNAAKVLGGVATLMFLDLSDSEQREIVALQARNKRLLELGTAKNCPAPTS